jgi:hypothetical protein
MPSLFETPRVYLPRHFRKHYDLWKSDDVGSIHNVDRIDVLNLSRCLASMWIWMLKPIAERLLYAPSIRHCVPAMTGHLI